MMKKTSKFVSLSQLASKATGGAYGGNSHAAPSLPPSSTGPSLATPTHTNGPHTPGGSHGRDRDRDTTMERKRMTWADRVREKLPPLDPNEYEVLWERGVLGVIFLESEKDGIPYVSKATESCISPLVQPGDILKFVNDVRSEKHSFSEFFKILATMKKPVLLRFERPRAPRTPSPDGLAHDTPAPSIGDHRSISANDISHNGGPSRATAMKDAAKALAAKVQRSNSLPQNDKQHATTPSPSQQKPVARGTFWRASTTKELATPSHLQATPKSLTNMPATPKTPMRRDMQSPVAKHKYDGDTDTSDSPNDPWDDDDRALGHDDEYQHIEVYWETGSLGLFFGEERGTGYPVVTRSTPGVNPSVHRKVQINDVLLAANGVRSADFSFEAFFARLQQMSKPVKLVFRRKVIVPGTPPPQPRKTSQPIEPPQTSQPSAPMSTLTPKQTPTSSTQSKPSNTENVPAAPSQSRPTRLPPPTPTSEIDIRHTTTNTAIQHQGNGSLRQEPSPSSKPRSTSVETRSLMADEHSPVGGSAGNLRGKSPSSRPDIVFLGSPQKKPRGPPPSPPANLVIDAAPSPRDKVDKKQCASSPQATSVHAPSPRDTRASPRPSNPRQDVFVLGDDFGVSPREKFQAVYINEDESETEDVEEAAADAHVIEEGVAVGVPLENTEVVEQGRGVESVSVTDAVLATMVEDAVPSSSKSDDSSSMVSSLDFPIEVGLPVPDTSAQSPSMDDETDHDDSDDSNSQTSTESESDEGESMDVMEQDDPDISGDMDNNEIMASDPKNRGSIASPSKPNKAALNASLAKYKKKSKNSRPMIKLPAINEDTSQTVPLLAPNAVNTNVQVRGRNKPKPSLVETPDSSTYLVKWKEGRSVGLQLREVRMAKGTFPLVVDICKEPCCDVLKHVCIGDVIVEINGRNCSTMGVKKTVNFLKTSSKTMLLKLRRGPAFLNERVSAYA